MDETEYIRAGNLTRLRAARQILESITPGKNITKERLREIIDQIEVIEEYMPVEEFKTVEWGEAYEKGREDERED